jgi:hypothetical protein
MTSLWSLAQERLQPDIQNMDQATLDKIKEHKPEYQVSDVNYYLTVEEVSLIKNLSPKPDWYINPEIISSIHGIAHTLRVMVYAVLLTRDLINDSDREALLIACSVHDTQRMNDRGDEGHEDRVISWLSEHFAQHPLLNQALMILRDTDALSKYLRAADALDRFRLPKVKWWIDDSYLEIKPTAEMKEFSFNLVVSSEQYRLNGAGDVESIFSCLQIR